MKKQLDLKALLENKLGTIKPTVDSNTIEHIEKTVPHNLMFNLESTTFVPETKPITNPTTRCRTVEDAKLFDDEMNRFIDTVLINGIDFGTIPNCKKPTLLKSGAEKILNYLGLIARTDITNRVEDYNVGFFSYEVKVYLIDFDGVVKGEGVGICNTKESKYAKSNGYAVQNTVIKMAKKRALVDATLNVGNLSARFTQDMEDTNTTPNTTTTESNIDKPITQNQLRYLETLMNQHNSSAKSLNKYVLTNWGIDDYKKITGVQASILIDKFKAV